MVSDINGKVVGIQENPVKDEALSSEQDGYVLTWIDDDNNWAAKPIPQASTGLHKEYFTTNGTWVCPTGITNILIIATGGGGGGGGASNYYSGGGGGGSIQQTGYISVSPSTTYNIDIGTGGAGGTGVSTNSAGNGGVGNSTLFKNGSAIMFSAAGGGGGGGAVLNSPGPGGPNFPVVLSSIINFHANRLIAYGGDGASGNDIGFAGEFNCLNMYSPGASGTQSGSGSHGGTGAGGGAGPQGNGGNGGFGNATNSGTGGNGSSASANTGAGGGGGGGSINNVGGNGGNGGSGYLYIIY